MSEHHHFAVDKKYTNEIIYSEGFDGSKVPMEYNHSFYNNPKGKERKFFENFKNTTKFSEHNFLMLSCEQLKRYGYGECTGVIVL